MYLILKKYYNANVSINNDPLIITTMKIIFSIIGLLFFISVGFSQNTNCSYVGSINGYDYTRCGYCGGWLIEVNGHIFRADSIPNAKVILGSSKDIVFPIPVYLDYKRSKNWINERIVITCIKKR